MEIKKFRGLNNTTSAERFGPRGFLDAADNVDVDDTGKVMSRLGTVLAQAGSYHSLWADGDICLAVSGSDLKRVNPDLSLTQLGRLLTSRRISYKREQNTVYMSNGVDTRRLHQGALREWGVEPPVSQPVAQPTVGSLPPGRYQYALTFRRADGHESGTGGSGLIELAAAGGVAFSSIEVSPDAEAYDKCLYLSGPNGEELYRCAVLDAGAAAYSYTGSGSDLTVRLETQFYNPPPAGDIVECYNGVMYVVSGGTVWHSKPYQFERFCRRDQFMQFPGQVTMFAAVNDGVYVSADDTTWFLEGTGPGDFKSHMVFDHGAIAGTAARTTAGVTKQEAEQPEGSGSGAAVMWASPFGICLGYEGGRAVNMTERDYVFPSTARGAGLVRQARGMIQYVVSLEGDQVPAAGA